MPGEITYEGEKDSHTIYLRDFRTQQCPDFLLHKCTNHRPFNCFSWHFANQKRRRPFKKKDGTFNYSPDIYCTKYDETTGICLDGDECPFLHRVAGDAERRYHLRYYKTCMCIYETDDRGLCTKNGANCAYAHGNDDLRQPMVDLLEGVTCNGLNGVVESALISQLENDMLYNDDPVWNDPIYVLINYKTEPCHRPHRLCRQGFACPSFHNPRDKRRCPQKFKYRSTPCPNVKHADEWGDPPLCDSGDNCSYCHTRTEQQFHPEIYKSSKCNDMLQTGYCPRGPFCAFAHIEKELTKQWPALLCSDTHLSDFFEVLMPGGCQKSMEGGLGSSPSKTPAQIAILRRNSELNALDTKVNNRLISGELPRIPEPIGKRRTVSLSEASNTYTNALRISQERQMLSRQQSNLNEGDHSNSFTPSYPIFQSGSMPINTPSLSSNLGLHSSPRTGHLFPLEDVAEPVLASVFDEDLGLGALHLNSYNDDDSLCSSLSTSYPTFNAGYLTGGTAPMSIPSTTRYDHLSQEIIRSFGSIFESSFNSFGANQNNIMSPSTGANFMEGGYGRSPLDAFLMNGHAGTQTTVDPRCSVCGHIEESTGRMNEELRVCRMRLTKWEEGLQQARVACNAWKTEVDEVKHRLRCMEDEKNIAVKQLKELTCVLLKQKMLGNENKPLVTGLPSDTDDGLLLESLSRDTLQWLRQKMKESVTAIEEKLKTIQQICAMCKTSTGKLEWMVCGHASLCSNCAKAPCCHVCQASAAAAAKNSAKQ